MGQSPTDGFDCSGFVSFVLNAAGLTIPDYIGLDGETRPIRHANEFWDYYGVTIHYGAQEPGDLILFSRNGVFPHHIGIVQDQETYIHAPGEDGTKVTASSISLESIKKVCSDRMLYVVNPIGFKSPTISVDKPNYRYHQRLI